MKDGVTIMEFPPEVMKGYEQIAKPRTIKLMQDVLRKVVSQGLAKSRLRPLSSGRKNRHCTDV